MSANKAAELLQQLESLDEDTIASLPENFRSRLCMATRKCSFALETPTELISRILITQPTEAIYLRVATDLHLFRALGNKALTRAEIAQATGAEVKLLDYLLRGLDAFEMVRKNDHETFAATPSCALLQNEQFENAFPGCQDFMQKIVGSWPAYLQSVGYRCPDSVNDTAVQYAFGTKGMSFWETFESDATRGALLRNLSVLMSTWADGFTQLQDIYPVKDRLKEGFDPQTVMFVDVGGNLGQKALALKKAFPDLPGRFVVQDLPQVIERAPKNDPAYRDIEMTAHDMFTEQPIKGARCYYVRQTLHNWQDGDAIAVLKRLRDAGIPCYSRVLLHEIIVPQTGVKPWVAAQDLNMLSMFALAERTEADWRRICEEAGLRLSNVYTNDNPSCEGIVEMEVPG